MVEALNPSSALNEPHGSRSSAPDRARERHLANLSAILAHEINNLMAPIVTRADFALSSDDPALIRKSLEKCLAQAQRVVDLAQRLSGYAEAQTCERVAESSVADLRDCVDAAAELLIRPPAKSGIEFLVSFDRGVQIAFDANDLTAVLLNLLLIALDNASQSRCPLRVSAAVAERGVKLRVEPIAASATPGDVERLNHAIGAWSIQPPAADAEPLDVRLRAAAFLVAKHGATLRIEPCMASGYGAVLDLKGV